MEIPDLRQRPEDIPPLVYHLIRRCNQEGGYRVEGMRREALQALLAYPWPGNVRELENVVERAVILRKAGLIQTQDLPVYVTAAAAGEREPTLAELERQHIHRLLAEHGGNRSLVARILGIDRRTLHRKLKQYSSS
jgi:Response regulator containing CheY-like receiver, AAA-type ATPase, and DNA-binding domains